MFTNNDHTTKKDEPIERKIKTFTNGDKFKNWTSRSRTNSRG